jgi:hypothetical protein
MTSGRRLCQAGSRSSLTSWIIVRFGLGRPSVLRDPRDVSQSPEQLHQAVSVETLKRFLTVRGEGDEWDFKERLDTESKLARAELARDALAFGNTPGGGTLILGVTKDYQHVGLERDAEVDTTRVRQAIERYIDGDFLVVAASHRITPANEDEEKTFGLIYVTRGGAHPLLAACDAPPPPPPRGELLFKAGDIFVRRGAQSIRANTGDIRRLGSAQLLVDSAGLVSHAAVATL